MAYSFVRPLGFLVCLSLFISQGEAIKCYICNSMSEPNCAASPQTTYGSGYLRDCNDLSGGNRYSVCRKIDQSFVDPADNQLKSRTIRECGQDDPATDSCYQKAGFGGRQYVCACTKDGCNGSSHVRVALGSLATLVFVALLGPKMLTI